MADTHEELVARGVACKLLTQEQVQACRAKLPQGAGSEALVTALVQSGLLTRWHVKQLAAGKTSTFFVSHYKLLSPLGAGGMGQVFRAVDLQESSRQVAIKILPRHAATATSVSRFRREGTAALQLQHNHIVRCFELGQQGDLHFLVMEVVDGATLKEYIARQGKLSVQETARIGHEVALALEYAWQRQIVHRDIKPSNILLTRDNHVKLTDLGLAKFFGPQGASDSLNTRTGMLLGTIDYLAPEQAEDAKRADIRSDIYSLGCTLYECLTGHPPFTNGTEVQKILAHREQTPTPICQQNKSVDNLFADVIERNMMAKRPEDRYQTPAEVAMALENWRGGASQSFNILQLLEEAVQRDVSSNSRSGYAPAAQAWPAQAPQWNPWGARKNNNATLRNVALAAAGAALVLLVAFGFWITRPSPDEPLAEARGSQGAIVAPAGARLAPVNPQAATNPQTVPQRTLNLRTIPPERRNPDAGSQSTNGQASIGNAAPSGREFAPSSGGSNSSGASTSSGAGTNGGNSNNAANPPTTGPSGGSQGPQGSGNEPPAPVSLRTLQPQNMRVDGNPWMPFSVSATQVGSGLFTRPLQFGGAGFVAYDLKQQYERFTGKVAIADGSPSNCSPVTFQILADGKVLFRSRALQRVGESETFNVDVTRVARLQLEVTCELAPQMAHAVWVDPVLSRMGSGSVASSGSGSTISPEKPQGWDQPSGQIDTSTRPLRPLARGSGVYRNDTADRAFAGDPATLWQAGGWPIQWIEADLRERTTLASIRLIVKQSPPCETEHEIWVSERPMDIDRSSGRLAHVFRGQTQDGQALEFKFPPGTAGRYVLVRTVKSGSWVSWAEIEIRAAATQPNP